MMGCRGGGSEEEGRMKRKKGYREDMDRRRIESRMSGMTMREDRWGWGVERWVVVFVVDLRTETSRSFL